ncbi:hypothetical protein P7K49_010000 [Saguinus oedipus]|uniref:Uncharacterized protein n=1 Tax=Saguinus oedipus TaxID=9490 RepID=A0ABQ9VLL8_SAGOE|nr:hypothetical protein P7K49_010000 [Saguinus oedipus]
MPTDGAIRGGGSQRDGPCHLLSAAPVKPALYDLLVCQNGSISLCHFHDNRQRNQAQTRAIVKRAALMTSETQTVPDIQA